MAASEHQWRLAGASWILTRSFRWRGPQMLEERDVIGQAQPKAGEMALQRGPQLGRQARGEFLVVLVDEPVLVAAGEGIGDAHADVLVGADNLAGAGLDRVQTARQPAVQMLHRGDPEVIISSAE
jgi:hypothetical protein